MKVTVEITFDQETGQYTVAKSADEMAEGMEGMEGLQPMQEAQPTAQPVMAEPAEGAGQTYQNVDEALQAAKQLLTQTDESMATAQDQQAGFDSVMSKGVMQ